MLAALAAARRAVGRRLVRAHVVEERVLVRAADPHDRVAAAEGFRQGQQHRVREREGLLAEAHVHRDGGEGGDVRGRARAAHRDGHVEGRAGRQQQHQRQELQQAQQHGWLGDTSEHPGALRWVGSLGPGGGGAGRARQGSEAAARAQPRRRTPPARGTFTGRCGALLQCLLSCSDFEEFFLSLLQTCRVA